MSGLAPSMAARASLAQLRHFRELSRDHERAFVRVLYQQPGVPELWLCTRDLDGLVKPCDGTGPLRLPPEWVERLNANP